MTCFRDMLCLNVFNPGFTPRSCLWRLMDARLHLVDADWSDGIGIKRSNASNYTKLSPSFQLPKNSFAASNPKRPHFAHGDLSWDVQRHVLRNVTPPHDGASFGFCRPGSFDQSQPGFPSLFPPLHLVGGIPTLLNNMKVSWDEEIPNRWEKKHVSNHQPVHCFVLHVL